MERIQSGLGLIAFILICFLFSRNRRAVEKRLLFWGIILQLIVAIAVLGIPSLGFGGPLEFVFSAANVGIMKILGFSDAGAGFVFGPLMNEEKMGGFIFATKVLPTIIFFSALVAALYHLGVLQKIVRGIAIVMCKFLKASGAESLSTAANIFLGQTEAPLLVKPYIARMTQSEILCVMIGGMANVAGGVMAAYVAMLSGRFPSIAGHLLTVSVLSAPSTLLVSKILLPEEKTPETFGNAQLPIEKVDSNLLEAITRGASEGLSLALNVAAMLIAFIALTALVNASLGGIGGWIGHPELSLQLILSKLFYPVAWLLGGTTTDLPVLARLLGEKVILNEFVAYSSLADISSQLSDRTVLIASYALCGFANVASIGIQIGGIGAMAPERRGDLAKLGLLALLGGNLATFVSAAIVGMLY